MIQHLLLLPTKIAFVRHHHLPHQSILHVKSSLPMQSQKKALQLLQCPTDERPKKMGSPTTPLKRTTQPSLETVIVNNVRKASFKGTSPHHFPNQILLPLSNLEVHIVGTHHKKMPLWCNLCLLETKSTRKTIVLILTICINLEQQLLSN